MHVTYRKKKKRLSGYVHEQVYENYMRGQFNFFHLNEAKTHWGYLMEFDATVIQMS